MKLTLSERIVRDAVREDQTVYAIAAAVEISPEACRPHLDTLVAKGAITRSDHPIPRYSRRLRVPVVVEGGARLCPQCRMALLKRRNEDANKFARRIYCSHSCAVDARCPEGATSPQGAR